MPVAGLTFLERSSLEYAGVHVPKTCNKNPVFRLNILYCVSTKGLDTTSINDLLLLLDFSLTVKAATLIFISGCGSAISSAKEGKYQVLFIIW